MSQVYLVIFSNNAGCSACRSLHAALPELRGWLSLNAPNVELVTIDAGILTYRDTRRNFNLRAVHASIYKFIPSPILVRAGTWNPTDATTDVNFTNNIISAFGGTLSNGTLDKPNREVRSIPNLSKWISSSLPSSSKRVTISTTPPPQPPKHAVCVSRSRRPPIFN